MIGYLMLGANNLEKSAAFYDALFQDLNASRAYQTEDFVAWSFGEAASMFTITKPFDKKPATVGNGVMVALKSETPASVDAMHAKALQLGGTNEGDPGQRGKGFYAAYFRDLDGNKLNVFCYV